MTRKSFLALCVAAGLGIVLAAVALFSGPRVQSSDGGGQLLVPNLVKDVDRLKSIVIHQAGETVSLDWDGKMWRYRERTNYPADGEKVTAMVVRLARMTKVEPKTSRPDRYDRLDLGDPSAKDSKASQVTLIDQTGKEIANLIVGKRKYTLGSREGGTYVRMPGDPQTWLAQGDVSVGGKPGDWLKREIVDIKEGAIKSITVTHPNGEKVIVAKGDPMEKSYTVENLPKGAQVSSPFAADDYGRVLANLSVDDVAPVASKPFAKDKTISAVIEGFTGFQVLMDIYESDGETWIKVKGVVPPPRPEPKAPEGVHVTDLRTDWAKVMTDMNARTEGWAFQVQAFTVGALTRHMSDLLKKADTKAKTPAPIPADDD